LIKRLAVSALALLLLAACGGPEIALVGTVTDAYTGKPVPNAVISVGGATGTTDDKGQYQIPRWSQKDTFQIDLSGYEPLKIALDGRTDLAQPQPPSATLNASIRPDTVQGLVTDQFTGKPLAGAVVRATEALSTTTGQDGRYTLKGVPEQFSLSVGAPDYAEARRDLKRATTQDVELRPNVLSGTVTDRATGKPLAGAHVSIGTVTAQTGADGRYRLSDVGENATVEVSAEGYATLTQPLGRSTTLDAVLRSDTLRGTLLDSASGKPVANATIIASPSLDSSDVAFARIDGSRDGSFALKGVPEQGFIQVLAPGYKKAVVPIKPGAIPDQIKLEPFTQKALYITVAVASSTKLVNEYLDLIDRTELNTIIIDLKSDLRDDLGLIYYDSQVPIVKELKTSRDIVAIKDILAEAKKRNIYTVARVAMFSHDNALADARPDWAAKDRTNGKVFADYPGPGIRYAWLDPWNQNVWDYNIQLSVEAAHMGFDEINFDYIRFPSLEFSADDKNRLQLSKENSTAEERYANIAAVLERAQRAINGAGSYLSIDVFGYTAWNPGSLIGQNIQILSKHTDYIMPMIYPSHFVPGELGFENPAQHPYEMISESIKRGVTQIKDKRALLRPWLQDFTLTWVPKDQIVEYGPDKVRAQIKAVSDFDSHMGWALYDSANNYTEEALARQ
jgi:hypothetical protein